MKRYRPHCASKWNSFLFLSLQFCLLICYGQTAPLPANSVAQIKYQTNPEVATLGNYIMQPPDLSSGAMKREIDLFEIKENGLNYPVSLFYNFDGFKLNEEASSIGLGWGITEDVIIRVPKHIPDEQALFKKFEEFQQPLVAEHGPGNIPSIYFCHDSYQVNPYDYTANRLYYKVYDAQPDLYIYKFGKYSGRFIWVNNKAIFLEQTDLVVEKQLGDYVVDFLIKTPEGIEYRFKEADAVLNSDEATFTIPSPTNAPTETFRLTRYVSAWRLSSVKNVNTKSQINFTYTTNASVSSTSAARKHSFTLSKVRQDGATGYNSSYELNSFLNATTHVANIVTEIESDHFKVKYTYTSRKDGLQNRLAFIELFNKQDQINPIRKILFEHNYFGDENSERTCWLKLKALEIMGAGQKSKYSFNYIDELSNSGSLNKDGLGIDHYGYYNGTSNTSLVPLSDISEYGLSTSLFPWANRNPDYYSAKKFALEQIIYPTGGYTGIGYESANGMGIRVRSQQDSDGVNTVSRYFDYGSNSNYPTPSYEYSRYDTYQTCRASFSGTSYSGIITTLTGTIATTSNDYFDNSGRFYPNVTEYIGSPSGAGGKIEYLFSKLLSQTLLIEKKYFEYGQNSFKKKETNLYSIRNQRKELEFWTIPSLMMTSVPGFYCDEDFAVHLARRVSGPLDPMLDCQLGTFHYNTVSLESGWLTFDGTTVIEDGVSNSITYSYAPVNVSTGLPQHTNVTSVQTTKSNGDVLTTKYYYHGDSDPDNMAQQLGIPQMYSSNFYYVSPVLEERSSVNGVLKKVVKNLYQFDPTNQYIYLKSTTSFNNGATLKPSISEFKYDDRLRLIEETYQGLSIKSCVFGYNGLYPVIIGSNITHANLLTAINSINPQLNNLLASVQSLETVTQKQIWRSFTDGLYSLNNGSSLMATTYNYYGGITSTTDAKGMTMYYEYDSFGRLKSEKDHNGKVLKAYDYHYKGQ